MSPCTQVCRGPPVTSPPRSVAPSSTRQSLYREESISLEVPEKASRDYAGARGDAVTEVVSDAGRQRVAPRQAARHPARD